MIVVDCETTGLYPETHSIASIGAVDFSNPSNQFYKECRIWKEAEVDEKALVINGFTKQGLYSTSKLSLEKTIKQFLEWTSSIRDITLAGENPSFDRDFLMNSCARYNIKWLFGYRTRDLHTTSSDHHNRVGNPIPLLKNRTNIDLDFTLQYVGLPPEPKPHHALTGAKLEAEAFSRLLYRKPLFKEYFEISLPDYI